MQQRVVVIGTDCPTVLPHQGWLSVAGPACIVKYRYHGVTYDSIVCMLSSANRLQLCLFFFVQSPGRYKRAVGTCTRVHAALSFLRTLVSSQHYTLDLGLFLQP